MKSHAQIVGSLFTLVVSKMSEEYSSEDDYDYDDFEDNQMKTIMKTMDGMIGKMSILLGVKMRTRKEILLKVR